MGIISTCGMSRYLWDMQIKQDMALIASQVLVWQNPGIHIQRLGKSQMVLGMSDGVQRQ